MAGSFETIAETNESARAHPSTLWATLRIDETDFDKEAGIR